MPRRRDGFFEKQNGLPLEQLDDLASRRIVRRGLDYAATGRVRDLAAAPRRLEARVIGTDSEPYLVVLEHDGEEILSSCSCPFDWEPFCKHSIAVLATHFGLGSTESRQRQDADSPEAQEHAIRRKRAVREGFKIKRIEGDGFFGVFEVHSPSSKTYQVEIRSLAEPVNRCSCLDHATSMLGTCKHIEAVLAAQRKRSKRSFARAAEGQPTVAQVLIDMQDVPRIRLILPEHPSPALRKLAAEFFDAAGYFLGDPVDNFARFLIRARRLRKLVIYSDAVELSERVAGERKTRQRRDEIRRAVMANGACIPGVKTELYPFQVEGAAFLAAAGRGLLADDMGLGKTVQAIAAAQVLRERGESRRALIVCPASLKSQWASEIERFTGQTASIVGGPPAMRLAQYRAREQFTIVNYELALRDRQGIGEFAPDLLILDEAQRIRNWRTKTAEAIKEIRTRFAFVLTGTPLQNRLDDLYSVMQVVDRRVFGPLWAYNEQFVVREEGRNRIEGYRNLDELRRRLAPVLLRRDKSEVMLQLPERIDSRFAVGMTARQREFMEEGVSTAAMLAAIAKKRPLLPKEMERLFKAMQRARMACNAAGLVDKETVGSPKLDELEQLLRDLCCEEGRKVVVFSEWEKFCRMAAERAERLGISYLRLHGGVPTAKRGDLIAKFRDDPDCKVFFSTDAGGVGLNLQFASSVINLELPWNPAVLDQRIGRVHRHGQKEPVHVFLLVAENSFESGLERTLGAKRSLFNAALDRHAVDTTVVAPTSCLEAVRTVLDELRQEGEPEQAASIIEANKMEPSSSPAKEPPESASPSGGPCPIDESVRKIEEILGSRLEKVLILPSGKVVALVDRADAVTTTAARAQGMVVAETGMVDGLASLGEDSPFASATVLLDRSAAAPERQNERRNEWLAVAERKLAAAETLEASNLGAEGVAQAHACMISVAKSMAADDGVQAELPPARFLYEVLVPSGKLRLEQAALISRAEGLATAYAESAQPIPYATVAMVITDARSLLEEARQSRGTVLRGMRAVK